MSRVRLLSPALSAPPPTVVHVFECRGCGAVLPGRRLRVYCSNACQRESERVKLVAEWIASGVASPGTGQRHYVRLHLMDEQRGKCAICGQPSSWNGAPLALVLDHVDGDSENNRRENLRLVCPNCDSQLPTYKSRNKGRGRHWRRQRYADGQSY
ncbi:HNH endonuclease [Nocardioides ungokensis]